MPSKPIRASGTSQSLVATVVVGMLLPVGIALLPLVTTALTGNQPYGFTMFWAQPDVLPFLALLGGGVGGVSYWLRGGDVGRAPTVALRVACALAVFAFVPLPLMLYPGSIVATAMIFLAPNYLMAGVALAWRVATWSGMRRVVATSLASAMATFWIVAMLAHAPDRHAALRLAALPAAIVLFVVGLYLGRRDVTGTD